MRFGPVPLSRALCAILVHFADLKDGRLRKRKVLDQGDLDRMGADIWSGVIIAKPDSTDLGEEVAAAWLGAALCGEYLRATGATVGRVNLIVTQAGVVSFAPQMAEPINVQPSR